MSNTQTEELEPSDVLEHAANLIDEWGWATGTFLDQDTGAMCHLGAIQAAAGFAVHVFEEGCWRWEPTSRGSQLAREARDYDQRAIRQDSIVNWNDRVCRSKAEAVAKLREAAALARGEGR